jgi:hypothetical protein
MLWQRYPGYELNIRRFLVPMERSAQKFQMIVEL